ncbi:MAG: hypothetical protein JW703_00170 [Candidatus Diapherotrites archaeon]|nr:hypothetical protein [Candidatus Diapherotrites archaeon]
MDKKQLNDKKLLFRLLMVPLLLLSFYMLGMSFEVLLIIGLFFVVIILLRGKMWKTAEHVLEKFLPFTKSWPDWSQKVLLFIIFLLIFMILKQLLYFGLSFIGIDLQAILMESMTKSMESMNSIE